MHYDDLHWVRVTWNLLMMNSNKRNIIETGNDAQTVYWFLQVHLMTKKVCVLCMSYLSLLVLYFLYSFFLFFFRCLCSFGWTNLREVCPELYITLFSFSVWEYKLSFVVHSACKWEISFLRIQKKIYSIGTVLIIGYQSSNLRINASRKHFVMSIANSYPYRRWH